MTVLGPAARPVLVFPLYIGTSCRSCGNVGSPLPSRAFQGRWKGWEACFWLSRLSTGRHFHSSFRLGWLFSFLHLRDRAPEAIRFRTGLQDVSAIRDPIQQRLAEPRIRNHLCPFGE